jgi:aminomethyltransferase
MLAPMVAPTLTIPASGLPSGGRGTPVLSTFAHGTPFHPRTASLVRKLQWREWAGYLAASAYADSWDIEYNAIRQAAAVIDVSPLYKYLVRGPDAVRLVDRILTRDATKIAVGQVVYACWCDEDGHVIDDGTVARLDETTFRWTAADPNLRWFRTNAAGLEVEVEEVSEAVAALALQGPLSRAVLEAATGADWSDVRYFRRRSASIAGVAIDVSRTGYTGDLGYELWIPTEQAVAVWDALMAAGGPYRIRPAGLQALDVARLEAGLILIEVDYVSARQAVIDEQRHNPYEIGLGRLVTFDKAPFVGMRALREVVERGPRRQLVGIELDWDEFEAIHRAAGLVPAVPSATWRSSVPVYDAVTGAQVGKATSGTWSPTLKRNVALASVASRYARDGTRLAIEWTVEAVRHHVSARVVPLPFLDLPRKRA